LPLEDEHKWQKNEVEVQITLCACTRTHTIVKVSERQGSIQEQNSNAKTKCECGVAIVRDGRVVYRQLFLSVVDRQYRSYSFMHRQRSPLKSGEAGLRAAHHIFPFLLNTV
jgi:hypothetical protein